MARTIETARPSEAPEFRPGAAPAGNPLARFVGESTTIFGRNLKKLLRIPMMLFFSLFQPMLWLLLFTQIFKKLGFLYVTIDAEGYRQASLNAGLAQN